MGRGGEGALGLIIVEPLGRRKSACEAGDSEAASQAASQAVRHPSPSVLPWQPWRERSGRRQG